MAVSQSIVNEYDFDSSDEEDIRNTVGNIPLQWYDSLAHIGYDTAGRPLMKPGVLDGKQDAIDKFLNSVDVVNDDSNIKWRTVRDPETGQFVILSDADVEFVSKLVKGQGVVHKGEEDPYSPWNEWFSKDVMQMPVTAHPPQKRSFVPSVLDRRRIGRMVHAIKSGWLTPRLPSWAIEDPDDVDQLRKYGAFMTSGNPEALDSDDEECFLGFSSSRTASHIFPDVWTDQVDGEKQQDQPEIPSWQSRFPMLAPNYRPPRPRPYQKAPDEILPGHGASYNPPPEFLLSKEEEKKVMKVWRDHVRDGQVSRIPPQMPRKFDCLRHVPFSERYLYEREERVKDLMMAARVEKKRVATTPDAILPQIPSLSDLKPYPSHAGLQYSGHSGRVTSLSVSPCGQWLASVSPSDGYLRIWEIATNYCFRSYALGSSFLSHKTVKRGDTNKGEEDDSDEEWSSGQPTALVQWSPNMDMQLVAAAFGPSLFIINPVLGDRVRVSKTDKLISNWWQEVQSSPASNDATTTITTTTTNNEKMDTDSVNDNDEDCVVDDATCKRRRMADDSQIDTVAKWTFEKTPPRGDSTTAKSKTLQSFRIKIVVDDPIISLDWHVKGDYLLTLTKSILSDKARCRSSKRILLHRLSKMSSQSPLADSGKATEWKQASFHPLGKPHLFVAETRCVRILDLVQQKELRCLRLDGSGDLVSSMALHPSGEHMVIGTYEGRFNWFDIELGNVPFKKLQLKHGSIRQVDIHSRRPLVSVAMSDGQILILHGKVMDDYLSKPTIIPVQLIATGQPLNQSIVFANAFHTRQPAVYTGGDDGSIRQFVAWH